MAGVRYTIGDQDKDGLTAGSIALGAFIAVQRPYQTRGCGCTTTYGEAVYGVPDISPVIVAVKFSEGTLSGYFPRPVRPTLSVDALIVACNVSLGPAEDRQLHPVLIAQVVDNVLQGTLHVADSILKTAAGILNDHQVDGLPLSSRLLESSRQLIGAETLRCVDELGRVGDLSRGAGQEVVAGQEADQYCYNHNGPKPRNLWQASHPSLSFLVLGI